MFSLAYLLRKLQAYNPLVTNTAFSKACQSFFSISRRNKYPSVKFSAREPLVNVVPIFLVFLFARIVPTIHEEAVTTLLPELSTKLGHNLDTLKVTNSTEK